MMLHRWRPKTAPYWCLRGKNDLSCHPQTSKAFESLSEIENYLLIRFWKFYHKEDLICYIRNYAAVPSTRLHRMPDCTFSMDFLMFEAGNQAGNAQNAFAPASKTAWLPFFLWVLKIPHPSDFYRLFIRAWQLSFANQESPGNGAPRGKPKPRAHTNVCHGRRSARLLSPSYWWFILWTGACLLPTDKIAASDGAGCMQESPSSIWPH